MPVLKIPTPLRPYAEGQSALEFSAETVNEIMQKAVARYPELKKHLYGDDQELRPFVNLFLGDENIQELQGLETELAEDDTLLIIPSIAGGGC